MPATSILDFKAMMLCSHGAKVVQPPTQARVRLMGTFALTVADQATIAGCPFTTGGNPSPCVTVKWTVPSTRVRIEGKPVLVELSVGLGQNPAQAPQGPLTKSGVQFRVKAM